MSVLGEMWIGITLAVLVEVVPTPLRTLGVAVYLFIISNIGGNMPLVVSPLQRLFVQHGITRVDALRGGTICVSVCVCVIKISVLSNE